MDTVFEPSGASTGKLSVTYLPPDSLKLDPRNPRRHDSTHIGQIAKSIDAFGFVVPVLIDREHKVIAGHGRVLAAKELGLIEVPTVQLDRLSAAQARAFQIADNRLTEIGTWDDAVLAQQLKDLSAIELNFSVEATGFTVEEIDVRIESLSGGPRASRDPADRLPAPGPAVTRPGDVWLLGCHRVICGNPLQATDYALLMQSEPAAMVFTSVSPKESFADHPGARDERQYTTLLTQACQLWGGHSADGAFQYLCTDRRSMAALLTAGQTAYGALQDLCVWAKDKADPDGLYPNQHELVLVFQHGSAPDRATRRRSNLWRYRDCSHGRKRRDKAKTVADHPNRKPVSLVADTILDCTGTNDIVLDAFLGCGTTVIAAERTGRRGYGIASDPRNVDTIVRRWQAFTGKTARHAGSGRIFADREAEVGGTHAV